VNHVDRTRTTLLPGLLAGLLTTLLWTSVSSAQVDTPPGDVPPAAALADAVEKRNAKAVASLLEKKADVNARQADGMTALHWAVYQDDAPTARALIQAGADFRKSIKSGFTPLFFAVREGRIEVTRRLLAAGVDVNGTMPIKKRRGKGPVKGTSPLLLAIENGHFELAAVLLGAGGNPNDDRTGYAPLHALSWIRKPDKGDSDSSIPPPIGSGRLTSLQFARKLVAAGADVNARKKDRSGGRRKISVPGTTAFLCAAGTADTAYMKTLLELGADPKINNAQHRTPLMMAAGIGEPPEADGPGTKPEHFEAVMFLLDLGVEINAVDKNGETAMHATAYKSLPKVAQLLSDRGSDIKIWAKKSKQGRTPLSIAQGYRPGNFKPSFETVAAIEKIMRAKGVTPPPPPKKRGTGYRD